MGFVLEVEYGSREGFFYVTRGVSLTRWESDMRVKESITTSIR